MILITIMFYVTCCIRSHSYRSNGLERSRSHRSYHKPRQRSGTGSRTRSRSRSGSADQQDKASSRHRSASIAHKHLSNKHHHKPRQRSGTRSRTRSRSRSRSGSIDQEHERSSRQRSVSTAHKHLSNKHRATGHHDKKKKVKRKSSRSCERDSIPTLTDVSPSVEASSQQPHSERKRITLGSLQQQQQLVMNDVDDKTVNHNSGLSNEDPCLDEDDSSDDEECRVLYKTLITAAKT